MIIARRIALLLLGTALVAVAFELFDVWKFERAPIQQRFEWQWREDVRRLEASDKLPPQWFDVKEIEVIPGTPETKEWLSKVKVPLKTKADGKHKLDVLIVMWSENDGAAMVQYNLEEISSRNNIFELGRTLSLGSKSIFEDVESWAENILSF